MKANHEKVKRLLLTARGQIEGLIKMVDEDRYCIDISTQLLATAALLKTANREVLAAHMKSCVKEAVENSNGEQKIDEVVKLLEKLMK